MQFLCYQSLFSWLAVLFKTSNTKLTRLHLNSFKNSDSLSALTNPNPLGTPFMELATVTSTNSYAMFQVKANSAGHGTAYFAHAQTAGRGQMGKVWRTAEGQNIILSVVADTSHWGMHQQFPLSMAMALGVHDFFSKYAGDESSVKWPNDLYWRDRKAGGILIESVIGSNASGEPVWKWAIIGIGININQALFPPELINPVSLKQITGKEQNTVALAKELCTCLENRYQQLLQTGVAGIMGEYNAVLYKKGEQIRMRKDNAAFNCTVLGVNEQGQLLVAGAMQPAFSHGEAEWVIV
jgi:BirA family biotin operon repressor/biotin-[acetyl-CoA-carboxylase] ligase